jgi:dTDP-4-amino-4,6-dideoxygalactose transaminase
MHGRGMFDKILKFEQALAAYTGAPYVVMTDCCTHAIELCLRYDQVKTCQFTPYTYLSVPMTMHKLGIRYEYLDHAWQRWVGEYPFVGTRIWDSARRLEPNMYQSGQMQCLSFGHSKPLQVGRGGAILLDDTRAYDQLLRMRYDGRNLTVSPWQDQQVFAVGYHYRPTPEEAELASALLNGLIECPQLPKFVEYPDLRNIKIIDNTV